MELASLKNKSIVEVAASLGLALKPVSSILTMIPFGYLRILILSNGSPEASKEM